MTRPRIGRGARLLYRDGHLCAVACLLSFAVYGALPADIEGAQTTESEAAA